MKIRDLDKNLRPREKAMLKGLDTLGDDELLSLILRTGANGKNVVEIARVLLENCHGFYGLFRSSIAYLSSFDGIGKTKAIEILALGEIARRIAKESLPKLKKPTCEELFGTFAPSMALLEKETVILLLYDRRGNFQGERRISSGTEDSVLVSHMEILRELLRSNAHYFYLLHNHPSGDPLPSKGEVSDTIRLKEEANELSLYLIDHIIMAKDCYFSFASNNLFSQKRKLKRLSNA